MPRSSYLWWMIIQRAQKEDLPFIVQMIADDKLGSQRESYESPLPKVYVDAFGKILNDPNQELMVVKDENNEIVGTLQLSFIQYLTYRGGIRAQIEAVRIRKDKRGQGIGKFLFDWAINRAQERKAHVVQLTTDKQRPDALRFYEELGFVASHEGMKLHFG